MLSGQVRQRRPDFAEFTPRPGQALGDVGWLSNMTGQIHQQPGLLRDLLSGLAGSGGSTSSGGIFSSPVAKAALAGIAAMLVKKVLGGR